MTSVPYLRFKDDELPAFFADIETEEYNENSIGIVFHGENMTVLETGSCHIFIKDPKTEAAELYVLHPDHNSDDKPDKLWVIEGDHYYTEILDELEDFLESNFYVRSDSLEEEEDTIQNLGECNYKEFITNIEKHTANGLNNYVIDILESMGKRDAIPDVKKQMKYFQVAFVAKDTNPDPLQNYELLEIIGDISAWLPATQLFIDFKTSKGQYAEITSNYMRAMHSELVSKKEQAVISKNLGLHNFIKSKADLSVTLLEDVFESFIGALAVVNFKIRAYTGIDYKLSSTFIKWIYEAYRDKDVSKKPPVTQFYDYMKVFIGVNMFKKEQHEEFTLMRGNRGAKPRFIKNTKKYLGTSFQKKTDDLFKLIEKPYGWDKEKALEERDNHFREVNSYIEKIFTKEAVEEMTNDRAQVDWSDDEKERFVQAMREAYERNGVPVEDRHYIVNKEFTDLKTKVHWYWVVKNRRNEELYSTEDYMNPEEPSALIDLINENLDTRDMGDFDVPIQEIAPNEEPIDDYFKRKNGSRFYLKPRDRSDELPIEKFISYSYDNDVATFYINIKDKDLNPTKMFMEYNPRIQIKFEWDEREKVRNFEKIRRLLDPAGKEMRLSPQIYDYIGNRATEGFVVLITFMKHRITNVSQITEIRNNFYRSKVLKRELAELINLRDEENNLISFNRLIGMSVDGENTDRIEEVINLIFMNLKLEADNITNPGKALAGIRQSISYQEEKLEKLLKKKEKAKKEAAERKLIGGKSRVEESQSAPKLSPEEEEEKEKQLQREAQEEKRKKEVNLYKDKTYRYTASDGITFAVKLMGHMAPRLKFIFSKEMVKYERLKNPNFDEMRSTSFRNEIGFDLLKEKMIGAEDWELSYKYKIKNSSKGKTIILRCVRNNILTCYSGKTIQELVARL